MGSKRRVTTIETHSTLIIRRRRRSVREWCTVCGGEVPMVSPDEGAAIAGVTSRTIYAWIENDTVHFSETPEGFTLVCLNSLIKNP